MSTRGSAGRDRILARIRAANRGRPKPSHPGAFVSGRGGESDLADTFIACFEAVGGEVVRRPDPSSAAHWLSDFLSEHDSVAYGIRVPDTYRGPAATASPTVASVGVSLARGAIAETGSLALDARDGRRAQLLPSTHVVLLSEALIFPTAREAFSDWQGRLPSAIGLHSGPSKSADIGQTLVKGVHGPGRIITLLIGVGS